MAHNLNSIKSPDVAWSASRESSINNDRSIELHLSHLVDLLADECLSIDSLMEVIVFKGDLEVLVILQIVNVYSTI